MTRSHLLPCMPLESPLPACRSFLLEPLAMLDAARKEAAQGSDAGSGPEVLLLLDALDEVRVRG